MLRVFSLAECAVRFQCGFQTAQKTDILPRLLLEIQGFAAFLHNMSLSKHGFEPNIQ